MQGLYRKTMQGLYRKTMQGLYRKIMQGLYMIMQGFYKKMPKPKPYCLMPWIHYHVSNAGRVKACCVANIPYGDCNTQAFGEIWNGKAIKDLRERFTKGESDNRCGVCRRVEEAGGKSIRQETHEKFGDYFEQDTPKLPVYFDIRFSNACNFACRTCWHGASSGWFPEAKKLRRNLGDVALLQNIEDFDRFISETGEALLQAQEIYFAGGEPLVTKEHYLLLDWLVKHKATKIRLRYNTNFSQLQLGNFNALEYWKQFGSVEIMASIDAHDKLGEYIRKGFDWKQFQANRDAIRKLPHIRFVIAPTISVFSILNLPELYRTCLMEQIIESDGLYINLLDRPLHYNVKALPEDHKQKVVDEFQGFYNWAEKKQIPQSIIDQFKECESYMMAEDLSKQWPRFLSETKQLDEFRKERLSEVLTF
ncbi:twitch domain-containing radical SAM protein [Ancylomarina longa]|uniref:Twitch domain-containing radical SAM protein n=1 Tax=Ancylomarina longa TaxID=2487017 RepID=A0A434AZM4_9BACT|nr:twitch domain-containing radical SAM protein [Ancylomarina longa]RUT79984.1 twitch domain-containing radical SAM protein [Ancylomarina longa]